MDNIEIPNKVVPMEETAPGVSGLAELEPVTVAPGHGKPLSGAEVAPSLRALAASFHQVAVPRNAA